MSGTEGPAAEPISLSQIAEIIGDDDAEKLSQILATGASIAEIERAVAWAAGNEEVLGKTPHPLEGRAAAVYDILIADEPLDDRR